MLKYVVVFRALSAPVLAPYKKGRGAAAPAAPVVQAPLCSGRYISWDESCKIWWLLKLEHLKSNRSNFKTNSVANRKPMQFRKNRCDATEPRYLGNHSSKSILDKLKASQIWNRCASQERVAEIKSGANYCCNYSFWSLIGHQSPSLWTLPSFEQLILVRLLERRQIQKFLEHPTCLWFNRATPPNVSPSSRIWPPK